MIAESPLVTNERISGVLRLAAAREAMDEMMEGVWWWIEGMGVSFVALTQCTLATRDVKTYCFPSIIESVVTASEALELIAAAEATAEKIGGYTTRRHVDYPTTDLPVKTVMEHVDISEIIERATEKSIDALVERCDAPKDLKLYDGFLVKYDPKAQAGLGFHVDGGRYSATIALSRPKRPGVTYPSRQALKDLQQRKSYHTRMCPSTCLGESCDVWRRRNVSRAQLHEWKCECSLCSVDAAFDDDDTFFLSQDFDFDGGGTRFPDLSNVTFRPSLGDAVVHGANQPHGGADILSGSRFLLAFFFDVPICRAYEQDFFDTFMLSIAIIAVAVVFIYIIVFADYDDSPAAAAAGDKNMPPLKKKKKKAD